METAIIQIIDSLEPNLVSVADDIWRHAELGLSEHNSARIQEMFLRSQGFHIESGVANMKTAFVATWGTKGPVIGFLGEYDALPGVSNKPVPRPEPVRKGAPGHGCGHNLLGTASMGAAVALKRVAAMENMPCTVKYFGCPAEESSFGKTWMVKAGIFDGADIVLTWHPGSTNGTDLSSSLADLVYKFDFYGKTAHAAGDPYNGRSALDGVELMNAGIERMREHMRPECRVHYIISHGGGAPNVVPDYAQNFFDIRAQDMDALERLEKWVLDIAKAGAMMTQTKVEPKFLGGAANLIPNKTIAETFQDIMERLGPPQWSRDELAFAQEMQSHFQQHLIESSIAELRSKTPELSETRLCDIIMPLDLQENVGKGSTDVADVSWVVPTGQFRTACYALGVPGHSWAVTSCGGMSIGHKGMLYAAKILGTAGVRFATSPELRQSAWDELRTRLAGKSYRSPIPEHICVPPLPFED